MIKGYFKINKKYITEDDLRNKYNALNSIKGIKIYYDYLGSYKPSSLICSLRAYDTVYIPSFEDLGIDTIDKCTMLYVFSLAKVKLFINMKEFDLSGISEVIEDNNLIEADGSLKSDSDSIMKLNNLLKRFRT